MGIAFNADEVFVMAEQIERNAAGFYREAAAQVADQKAKATFLRLAAMEDGHMRAFQQMRKGLAGPEKDQTTFDPQDEAVWYLQALADSKGFEGMRGPTQKLTGRESLQELLGVAIEAEKNSVLYYVGLRGLVSEGAGRDKVEAIIHEEVRHVAELRRQLAAVAGKTEV